MRRNQPTTSECPRLARGLSFGLAFPQRLFAWGPCCTSSYRAKTSDDGKTTLFFRELRWLQIVILAPELVTFFEIALQTQSVVDEGHRVHWVDLHARI